MGGSKSVNARERFDKICSNFNITICKSKIKLDNLKPYEMQGLVLPSQ